MCRPNSRPMKRRWRRIPRIKPALVTEATIFENHKLTANALDMYYKLREQWPDAVWVKSKIFESGAGAGRSSVRRHGSGADRRADLRAAGRHLEILPSLSCRCSSPTRTPACSASCWKARWAGASPRDNVLLLTDEKATTAAVRNGFQDFLKRRAGKNDTVVILIAGTRHRGNARQQERVHPDLRFRSAGSEEHRAWHGRIAIAV